MSIYALLGATGSTGSAILQCLIGQPPKDLTINILVRSRSKLMTVFPDLESISGPRINIIDGLPGDTAAMRECLKDVDVVMACIGSNYSVEGITLIYDTATAIIDALEYHQQTLGSVYKTPTIIQLRSASLNPIFKAGLPLIARTMADFCFYYVYMDLGRACELFASSAENEPSLLDYIFIDPPSIHDAKGTTPTGYKLILEGKQETALSYADLGAAFCEVAERKNDFSKQGVGVTATGLVNMEMGVMLGYIFAGMKGRIWG